MQELLIAAGHAQVIVAFAQLDRLFDVGDRVVDAPGLVARMRTMKKGLPALVLRQVARDRRIRIGVAFGDDRRIGLLLGEQGEDVRIGGLGRGRVVRGGAKAGEEAKREAQRRDAGGADKTGFRSHARRQIATLRRTREAERIATQTGARMKSRPGGAKSRDARLSPDASPRKRVCVRRFAFLSSNR